MNDGYWEDDTPAWVVNEIKKQQKEDNKWLS